MTQEGLYPFCTEIWADEQETLDLVVHIVHGSMYRNEEDALDTHFFRGIATLGDFDAIPRQVIIEPAMTLETIQTRLRSKEFCRYCLRASELTHHDLDCPKSPWKL